MFSNLCLSHGVLFDKTVVPKADIDGSLEIDQHRNRQAQIYQCR